MNRSRKIRVTAIVLALTFIGAAVLLLAPGCGGNTPSSAAGDMVQKLSDHQFGEAYDSFASNSKMRSQATRDQFIAQFSAVLPEGSSLENFSVTEEKIDGDNATVSWTATVKVPNAPDQQLDEQFQLVNEDGTWKIDG